MCSSKYLPPDRYTLSIILVYWKLFVKELPFLSMVSLLQFVSQYFLLHTVWLNCLFLYGGGGLIKHIIRKGVRWSTPTSLFQSIHLLSAIDMSNAIKMLVERKYLSKWSFVISKMCRNGNEQLMLSFNYIF